MNLKELLDNHGLNPTLYAFEYVASIGHYLYRFDMSDGKIIIAFYDGIVENGMQRRVMRLSGYVLNGNEFKYSDDVCINTTYITLCQRL